MRITIAIDGLKEAQSLLTGFSDRRMNAALATALTKTAVQVRDAERTAMASTFDRPTPYTLGSLYLKGATATDLAAEVGFKGDAAATRGGRPAIRFLAPEIEGGTRRMKGFERSMQRVGALPAGWQVVPGAYAQLDAFGNINRTQLAQILGHLRTNQGDGKSRVRNLAEGRKGLGQQRKASGRYFVIQPGKKGPAPGVYLRATFGAGREIFPVLVFVRSINYPRRYAFEDIGLQVVQTHLAANVEAAVADHVARPQARSQP